MEGLLALSADKYPLLLPLLLPALLVCVLVPIILLRRSPKLKLPPGPRGLPFIGHLHLLGTNPHHSLCELSRIHGPFMYLRFGSVPVVVASTPTMARQILQTHDQTFSFRSQPVVAQLLHGCENVLFSQPGPYWKLMRQICLTDLFGSRRLQSFQPLIAEEIHALLRAILDTADDEVHVRAKLYDATSNIISRMAVGKRLADLAVRSQADPSHNLLTVLVEAIGLLGVFNVGDFIPSLAWMDLQGCVRKMKHVARRMHTVWQEVIDERREVRRQQSDIASEERDFLDVLMTASESRPEIPVTDSRIMAILTDMYAAGTDTSSISTEWALGELLTHPMKLKKLQDEIDHVVGTSRLVREADIPQLPYLHAVVKETMRLHPVLPLLVPHKAGKECNISGYDIPAGTLAYVNVWAIGRDPVTWERPLEFEPERFLDGTMDVRGQHFELLPFGSGRRACPALILGLTNVHYMLASIIQCFDWSTVNKPKMSEKFGIVMTLEHPIVAKATPRLPRHLFE